MVSMQGTGKQLAELIGTISEDLEQLENNNECLDRKVLQEYYSSNLNQLLDSIKKSNSPLSPNALNIIILLLGAYAELEKTMLSNQPVEVKKSYLQERSRIVKVFNDLVNN